nr:MAG TPA: KorB domain [Caudoviricetes sp.]
METIITMLGSDIWTVLVTLISVILVFVGIIASKVLLLLAKKLGIDVDDQTMKTIQSLVNKLVQAMNQSVVNDLKKMNPDGKLTAEQKAEVFNRVRDDLEKSLTDEEKQYLINKFKNLDTALKALIESSVGENHK